MKFAPKLERGRLLKRYKRFLADVSLEDGTELTIHCPNTGAMKNCLAPGEYCWFSTSDNPKRKYPNTWELATTPAGDIAGINSALANALVLEGIENQTISELQGYSSVRKEVRYGEERSRIDILLEEGARQCYVEVKSVTLAEEGGQGLFPDAVSERGRKHLRELMVMCALGHRAVLLYCVQHGGIDRVSPADEIDPLYGKVLREAAAAGVELIAYGADISPQEIVLRRSLPVIL